MSSDRLADRTKEVERSAIRVMFDLAQDVEASGRDDLVHLEIGEPDFDTPGHITEAAHRAAAGGATHYTSNAGLLELRTAIAEKTMDVHGFTVDPADEVLVTTGAMEALALAMFSVVSADDEVVIPTPAWPNYRMQTILAGAKPVEIALDSEVGFSLDSARIIDAMSERTGAVVLTTPSNPTGQVADPDAVCAVVDAADEHNAYVIADEVYSRLLYDDCETGIAGYVDHPERVLTVESCSKTYAMTGWRVGWLLGPSDVIHAATTFRESTTACTSSVSQHAAIAALTGSEDKLQSMRSAFRERRNYVADRVASIDGISCPTPEGAFYVFLNVSKFGGSSFDIAKKLLYDYGVVTAPGNGFGEAGEGFLRLSFANSMDRLETGLDRIEEYTNNCS